MDHGRVEERQPRQVEQAACGVVGERRFDGLVEDVDVGHVELAERLEDVDRILLRDLHLIHRGERYQSENER